MTITVARGPPSPGAVNHIAPQCSTYIDICYHSDSDLVFPASIYIHDDTVARACNKILQTYAIMYQTTHVVQRDWSVVATCSETRGLSYRHGTVSTMNRNIVSRIPKLLWPAVCDKRWSGYDLEGADFANFEASSEEVCDDSCQNCEWCNAWTCLLYTSPSPRDRQKSRMPSSA